jgi:hypothetical protein
MAAAFSLLAACIIVTVVAVGGLVIMARRAGRDAGDAKDRAETLKAVETRNAIEADVAADPDPAQRLQRWQRD